MKHPKHSNQVRIIGGSHRSRVIRFHDADGLRPSADMVREKLFNWLGQRLDGKKVLDLFAGSGILGFEAASRGATDTVLVESYRKTYADIAANHQALGLPDIHLHHGDALSYLQHSTEAFDVVFLDPPYAWQDWTKLWPLLLPRLNPAAEMYIEAADEIALPADFTIRKHGKSGISHFMLAQYNPSTDT